MFCRFAAAAVIAADDEDDFSTLSSPSDVMEVADADSQQTTNEHLATSASALISNYILAKLLGNSPARIPTGARSPLDGIPQLPSVQFPAVPYNSSEDDSRLMSADLYQAAGVGPAANKPTESDVDDAGMNQLDESVDPADDVVRRMPVENPAKLHHRHHHRVDVSQVEEMLMEWNGSHGKARSVSNAAANLVIFAPLSPGNTVVRRPEVVLPTVTSTKFQLSPPSTVPNNLSSLRAIVEKSLLDESGESQSATVTGEVERIASDDIQESGNASTADLEAYKSGPAAVDVADDQVEDIGLIAQDQDYVTPVTGFHLRPRLFPGATQPRVDPEKRDRTRTASVSLLLPPDNSPWTISEDPKKITASEHQLSLGSSGPDEGDVIKATAKDRKSNKAESLRGIETNVATTDPSVYTYTVLSAATQRSDDEERDDIDDVRDDVEYDVGYDDEDYADGIIDSLNSEDDRSQPVVQDTRRLSPEFLRVMQSLWPGLEICAGPQCNDEDTSAVDDEAIGLLATELRPRTEHDFTVVRTTSTESLVMPTSSAGDVTVTSRPLTTVSSGQVRATTSFQTEITTSSPHHELPRRLAGNTSDDKLSATRRTNVRLDHNATADSHVNMTSNEDHLAGGDEDHHEGLKTTVTTTASGVQLVGNMHDRQLPQQQSQQRSLTDERSMAVSRKVNSNRSRPAWSVQGTPRAPIRSGSRPFHLHHFRADATRDDTNQRAFGQRQDFLPPIFAFRGNPTVVKPRPDLRGFPGIRRVQIVDKDSGSVTNSKDVSETKEQTRLRRPGSPFSAAVLRSHGAPTHPGLPHYRTVALLSQGSDHKELLEKTTASTVARELQAKEVRKVNGETSSSAHFSAAVLRSHGAPTHSGQPHDRNFALLSQGSDHKELLEKTTASTVARELTNGARKVNGETGLLAAIIHDRIQKTTGSGKANHRLNNHVEQSASKKGQEDKREVGLKQATQTPGSGVSSSSRKDQGQNVRDDGTKTTQFADDTSEASALPSFSEETVDIVTRPVLSTHGAVDSKSSTSNQPLDSKSTEMSNNIDLSVPPTPSLQTVPDSVQTAGPSTTSTTAIGPMLVDSGAVSPEGGEPLPVHSRPGEQGHSAAAIAMLGGYADWMVGLISAVAVAVFIFLAILSFLAVVSCRCVSSR